MTNRERYRAEIITCAKENNDCATRKFSYAKLPEENGGK